MFTVWMPTGSIGTSYLLLDIVTIRSSAKDPTVQMHSHHISQEAPCQGALVHSSLTTARMVLCNTSGFVCCTADHADGM